MRDVGERPAVNESRRALERLHQIGRDGVLQQGRHGAVRVQLLGAHRFALARIADNDIAKTRLQILKIVGEAEDRHDLGSDRNVEAGLARIAVGDAAERTDNLAQRSIVHVQYAPPRDAAAVDAKRIAPINVIVDQRREQIVRSGDGVKVAGEMEVDILHRDHLRIAAAGGTAFDAEAGPERRLAQAHHRLLADVIERVGKPDRRRGLALAGRRRSDSRHQDQLAVLLALERLDVVHRDLGLVVAIGLEILGRDAKLFLRHIEDAPRLGGLRDFNVGLGILVL